jgi:hypothetical protein
MRENARKLEEKINALNDTLSNKKLETNELEQKYNKLKTSNDIGKGHFLSRYNGQKEQLEQLNNKVNNIFIKSIIAVVIAVIIGIGMGYIGKPSIDKLIHKQTTENTVSQHDSKQKKGTVEGEIKNENN